jgi:hypothetical protein
MNDALMIGIVLTLVFGSIIFYLYNRLSLTERKMGLFEGVLTDLKIMMDSAPYASGPPPMMQEFEPTPEYLNAISGPIPLQNDEVEQVAAEEEYQQALEQTLASASAMDESSSATPTYRSLQIDELPGSGPAMNPINVTKLSPDLDSMTVKELQGLAKQKGLVVPGGTRRKDLIELLKTNDGKSSQPLQGTLLSSWPESSNEGGESLVL